MCFSYQILLKMEMFWIRQARDNRPSPPISFTGAYTTRALAGEPLMHICNQVHPQNLFHRKNENDNNEKASIIISIFMIPRFLVAINYSCHLKSLAPLHK